MSNNNNGKRFKKMSQMGDEEEQVFAVGLVGYLNEDKSSTLNSLIDAKKTSVSSTPGKTKRFQVINENKQTSFQKMNKKCCFLLYFVDFVFGG